VSASPVSGMRNSDLSIVPEPSCAAKRHEA